MRISDWSSDVCSSDLIAWDFEDDLAWYRFGGGPLRVYNRGAFVRDYPAETWGLGGTVVSKARLAVTFGRNEIMRDCPNWQAITGRSEEHTSELQSPMRTSYAVVCLKQNRARKKRKSQVK